MKRRGFLKTFLGLGAVASGGSCDLMVANAAPYKLRPPGVGVIECPPSYAAYSYASISVCGPFLYRTYSTRE